MTTPQNSVAFQPDDIDSLAFYVFGLTVYWQGNGKLTTDIRLAKRYSSWQSANRACNAIKKIKACFASGQDIIDTASAQDNASLTAYKIGLDYLYMRK